MTLRDWAFAENRPDDYTMVIHAEKRPAAEHVRRYNGPTASEVAAIIPGPENGEVAGRYIILRRRGVLRNSGNEVFHRLPISHRSYDPLSYVLLFPYGQNGWHVDIAARPDLIEGGAGPVVTPRLYYAYQLFQRCNSFNTLLRGGRLFQKYLVDQYCKVEAKRLKFIRRNQETLRAADYTTIQEALADAGNQENELEFDRAGRSFVLPLSYIGGDRYMRQNMYDIIAISNKVGHPNFFRTITCNPAWPEITREQAQDRPDLCGRVFHMKLQEMMRCVQV